MVDTDHCSITDLQVVGQSSGINMDDGIQSSSTDSDQLNNQDY